MQVCLCVETTSDRASHLNEFKLQLFFVCRHNSLARLSMRINIYNGSLLLAVPAVLMLTN